MMTISSADIKTLISNAHDEGFTVGLRDVSYAVLCTIIEPTYAFRSVFGDDPEEPFQSYRLSDKVDYVSSCIKRMLAEHTDDEFDEDEEEEPSGDDYMSFDEIKAGLEEDLKSLIELRDGVDDDGKSILDPKEKATVVGRIADIRTKLVERFGSSEKKEEQRVVVLRKFSDICPYCNHEIAIDPSHEKLFK